MKVIELEQLAPLTLDSSVLTIGNYDGLHLGHRKLIECLVQNSKKLACPSLVMTFRPHPMKILQPQSGFRRLFSYEDLASQLDFMGVDYLLLQEFSSSFASMAPEIFLEKYLWKKLRPKLIVVGYDFSFGARRTGSLEILKAQAIENDCEVKVCSALNYEGSAIGSSRIKTAVLKGRLPEVKAMLGRDYYIDGQVVKGDGRGRQLGIATANIESKSEILPLPGVYATRLFHGEKVYNSVSNLGFQPTFKAKNDNQVLETHVLAHELQLYGEFVALQFCARIRDEKKFASSQELIQQIGQDIEKAKTILIEYGTDDKMG